MTEISPDKILVPDASGRIWIDPIHIAAGYHEQIFGPIPESNSKLIGRHTFKNGNTITVEHIEQGPSGNPELRLEWENGKAVTVIDEATAYAYLALEE